MSNIDKSDEKLISIAKDTIEGFYRKNNTKHTVGACVMTKSNNIYKGVNFDGIHSICAEQSAIVEAYMNEGVDTQITKVVAVGKWDGIISYLSPCGNCRQFLSEYAPNAEVILEQEGQLIKVPVQELLPSAYKCHVNY